MNFNVTTTIKVTPQIIADMIVGAIEGGSQYWVSEIRYIEGFDEAREKPAYSDLLVYVNDFELGITTVDGDKHVITPESVQKGIQVMCDEYRHEFDNMMNEHDDASTHDVFFQCITLGKMVYC